MSDKEPASDPITPFEIRLDRDPDIRLDRDPGRPLGQPAAPVQIDDRAARTVLGHGMTERGAV